MSKKFLAIFAALLSLSFEVKAGLKLDALAMIERAPLDFAGDLGESAGVVTDVASAAKEIEQTGQRAKTLYEKGKLLKENAMETLNSVVPGYGEETQESQNYEEEYEKAQQQLDNTPSSLETTSQEADYAMQERREALYQEVLGKKQAAEENVAQLEVLFEQAEDSQTKSTILNEITAHESQIEQYEAQMADLESDDSQILQSDETYQEASKTKEIAEEQADKLLEAAKSKFGDLGLDDLEGLKAMSPEQKTAEYNKVIKDNFLYVDEPEDAEGVTRVKKKRADDLVDAIAKAIVACAKFKNSYEKRLEDIDRVETNVMGADQQISAIGLIIEQTIQEIKILQEYNKLLLIDMRVKTARDMVSQDYRLNNYEKDPASLNLDNYVFTEDDIKSDEGKKSFLDNVKAK